MATYSNYGATSPQSEEEKIQEEIAKLSIEIAEKYAEVMDDLGIEDFQEEMKKKIEKGEIEKSEDIVEKVEEYYEEEIEDSIREELNEISFIVFETKSLLRDTRKILKTIEYFSKKEGKLSDYLDMEKIYQRISVSEELLEQEKNEDISSYISSIKLKLEALKQDKRQSIEDTLNSELKDIFNITKDSKDLISDMKEELSINNDTKEIDYDIRRIRQRLDLINMNKEEPQEKLIDEVEEQKTIPSKRKKVLERIQDKIEEEKTSIMGYSDKDIDKLSRDRTNHYKNLIDEQFKL